MSLKIDDNFDYALARTCLNCSHAFAGRYCPRCGEKVLNEKDRSLRHYFSDVFNAFTFIDGKFFKSFRTLVASPGKMSRDIVSGIRQPYMKPIAFFFVANFLYFLFPFFQTFNTSFHLQAHAMPYSELAQTVIDKKLSSASYDPDQLEAVYNASSTNWAKMLLIMLVVYLFPVLILVNYQRRVYTLDHLAFTLEFMTFVLFVPTLLVGSTLWLIVRCARWADIDLSHLLGDQVTLPIVLILFAYFFVTGIRRFYGFPWWRTILNSVLLIAGVYLALVLYRFTLFFVTMSTV